MIFTSEDEGRAGKADGRHREVTRTIVRQVEGGDGPGESAETRRFAFRVPGGLSRDDILSTLKEQGVIGAQADAIADKLEAKRRHSFRSEEHTSELQSLMRISYAVFCLKTKK